MVRPSKIQIEDCSAELPELQKCEWYKVKGPSRLHVMRVALSGPWVGEAVKNSLSHAGGEVCGLRDVAVPSAQTLTAVVLPTHMETGKGLGADWKDQRAL